MITSKVKKRHLLIFVVLVMGLVLSLTGVALYKGEQHPETETFRLVFYSSILGTIVFAALLVVGTIYLLGRRRRPDREAIEMRQALSAQTIFFRD